MDNKKQTPNFLTTLLFMFGGFLGAQYFQKKLQEHGMKVPSALEMIGLMLIVSLCMWPFIILFALICKIASFF